jgi:hypothetical protein
VNPAAQELAAVIAKAKALVDRERKLHPKARILSATPMQSSASVREAALLQSLERVPAAARTQARLTRPALLIFVSESAIDEDGAAGKLLLKIIQAMGLKREDVALLTLQSLPPLIETLKPRALVALGEGATQALLKSADPLGRLRGRFADCLGLPLMPTHHPSELLNNDALKRHVWEDMKLVAARLKS